MAGKKGPEPKLIVHDELAHTHTHRVRPRQGGKRNEVLEIIQQAASAKKPHRVTPPMTHDQRLANYQAQNARTGRKELTAAQSRRLRKGDDPAKPVRQRFHREPRIDNQRVPTGRVGAKRWGPQMSIEGLNKLLFRSRTSMKGVAGTGLAATVASQVGRQRARTGHGRRRQNRGSRRNG